MADEELQVHGSPWSPEAADSADSCLRALAQDTQRVFRIPHKSVLDMLLEHLGLSPAQYERDVHEDGTIRVTIHFNTSMLDLGGPISDVSVPGTYSTDDERAEDNAAIKAVGYIEHMTNTVVRDLNHARLRRQEHRAEHFKQKLKEAKNKIGKLARGWLLSVRHMHYYSMHVQVASSMDYSVQDLPEKIEHTRELLEGRLDKEMRP